MKKENQRELKKYDPAKEQKDAEFAHSCRLWDKWQAELQRGKNPFNDARETGKVKFFNRQKGYGYILTGGGDLFFHIEQVENRTEPETGQLLKFERVAKDDGREKAINISMLSAAEQGLVRLGL
jgi:cold shock CspA family protein